MTEHKTKSFNFFRGRFSIEPFPFTLEELLMYSMADTSRIERIAPLDDKDVIENPDYYGFIGYKEIREGFWCAGFFSVEKDKVQYVFPENLDAEEIVFTPAPPPIDQDGNKQQYLDGKLYFICTKNDLILSADRRLSHRHLEKYLNYIIHKRLDLSDRMPEPEGYEIRLTRPPSRNTDIKNVKRIDLSVPSIWNAEELEELQDLENNRYWNTLKTFIDNAIDWGRINTSGLNRKERLKMDLSLALDKKTGDNYSDDFDSIVNILRYADEEIDYKITTDSGTFTRDSLTLRKGKSVEHIADMPVNQDIFNKMVEWHSILLHNGDI